MHVVQTMPNVQTSIVVIRVVNNKVAQRKHQRGPPTSPKTIKGEASFSNHPIGTSPNELVHFTPFQDYHKYSKLRRVVN